MSTHKPTVHDVSNCKNALKKAEKRWKTYKRKILIIIFFLNYDYYCWDACCCDYYNNYDDFEAKNFGFVGNEVNINEKSSSHKQSTVSFYGKTVRKNLNKHLELSNFFHQVVVFIWMSLFTKLTQNVMKTNRKTF